MDEINYIPIKILDILINEFIPYRGFELSDKDKYSTDKILRMYSSLDFIEINAINKKNPRGQRDKILFIITNEYRKVKNIKKIIENNIEDNVYYKNNTLDELFLVTNVDTIKNESNMEKIYNLIKNQKPNDYEGLFAYITICPHKRFAQKIPDAVCVFKHTILTNEEANKILEEEKIDKKSLNIIFSTDPPVLWEGGRIGEIVHIERTSETSLKSMNLRIIKR